MAKEFRDLLVIDDDVVILRSIEKQLRNEKLNLELVNDPLEGLEYISKKEYDLVLCDIKMKMLNGLEVLKRIKTEYPGIPVIMLTGFVDDRIIECAKKIGSSDFLIKPVRRRKLIDAIYKVLPDITT